jgi:hypothetical protein
VRVTTFPTHTNPRRTIALDRPPRSLDNFYKLGRREPPTEQNVEKVSLLCRDRSLEHRRRKAWPRERHTNGVVQLSDDRSNEAGFYT